MVAAGLTLVAGVLLLVAGLAAALTRRRLAGAVAQWLRKRGGGKSPDVETIARIILVVGVVVAIWGATLVVWGWLETDFIEASDAR